MMSAGPFAVPEPWRFVTLGDVCSVLYGKALRKDERLEEGTVPVYGSSGVVGLHEESLHPGPSVVIGRKGSVGSAFLVQEPFWAIDTAFYLDGISPHILPEFLSYALSFIDLSRFVIVAGVPGINRGDIERAQIPLPPLSEQRRIVEIMQEAEAVRRLRAEAARKTADLIPAIFHAMFGDPAENSHEWPTSQLAALASRFSDGPFGSNLKSAHYRESGVRVIRLQNIGVGELSNEDEAYISEDHFGSLPRHECLPGDVLIGTLGDPNLRACIQPETVPRALNKADCVQFRPNREYVNAEYVCWILNLPSTLRMAEGLIAGQTRSRISMGRLGTLPIPVPPLDLQQKFAALVQEIQASRELFLSGGGTDARLTSSLLGHAFTGNLTTEWRAGRRGELEKEAAARDAALGDAGVRIRTPDAPESKDDIGEDLRLMGLTVQQRSLARDLLDEWKSGECDAFTPQSLAPLCSDWELKANPDLVRRHLDVLAARGFVLRLSRLREQKTEDSVAVLYRRVRIGRAAFSPESTPDMEAEVDDVRAEALNRMAARLKDRSS